MSYRRLLAVVLLAALAAACAGGGSRAVAPRAVSSSAAGAADIPSASVTARPIAAPSVLRCAGEIQMGLVSLPTGVTAPAAAANFARQVRRAQPQSRLFATLVRPFLAAATHSRASALADRHFRTASLLRQCASALQANAP